MHAQLCAGSDVSACVRVRFETFECRRRVLYPIAHDQADDCVRGGGGD